MKKTQLLSLLSLLFCLNPFLGIPKGFSQEATKDKVSLLDEMVSDEPPEMVITTDIQTVFDDWRAQSYHPTVVKITLPDGTILQEKAEVRARGKFRSRFCDNPPLKLKFPKKSLKEQGLKKWNEFKLVYPCNSTDEFQHYVLKEYLIYRLYNVLTGYSYRVQLLDLHLRDATGKLPSKQYTGFLIEDMEELTDRMATKKDAAECGAPIHLDQEQYALFQVFQFAIGNTDWEPINCRNLDVISTKDERLIPIPYDFDFSGMVAAGYASPNSLFDLSSVLERHFMGYNRTLSELQPIFDLFQEKKKELLDIIKSCKALPSEERVNMMRYLHSFYRILKKSPRQLEEIFVNPMEGQGVPKY